MKNMFRGLATVRGMPTLLISGTKMRSTPAFVRNYLVYIQNIPIFIVGRDVVIPVSSWQTVSACCAKWLLLIIRVQTEHF